MNYGEELNDLEMGYSSGLLTAREVATRCEQLVLQAKCRFGPAEYDELLKIIVVLVPERKVDPLEFIDLMFRVFKANGLMHWSLMSEQDRLALEQYEVQLLVS